MKILIVSKCPTHPTDAGNKCWILSQTETFISLGHEVHFLYIQELPLNQTSHSYVEDLNKTRDYWGNCFHLFNVPKLQKFRINLFKYYRMKFCNNHWGIDDQYTFGVEKMVNDLDRKYHFDICIVNYYYLSRLFEYITIPKKAIATHDAFAYKDIKIGSPILCLTPNIEAKAMQRCPHIFALQEQEADYFQILSPQSNVYNLFGSFEYHKQSIVGNHKIVFLSGNNLFNQNGIKWFLKEVFPLIRKNFPDAELLIGGGICKVLPMIGNIDGVKALGYIDDPAAFYAFADVAINPVYQGTGLKIKTFEAISYDKIVMAHPHSMAGVFDKSNAPIFASVQPLEWIKYLSAIWGNSSMIAAIKRKNEKYLNDMDTFIISEYKRFLNS